MFHNIYHTKVIQIHYTEALLIVLIQFENKF